MTKVSTIRDFPVVNQYKYLGVMIDDALQLKDEVKVKKDLE